MPQVSEERLTKVVSVYAGLVGRVLDDPERWLGWTDDEDDDPSLRERALEAVSHRLLGKEAPGTRGWAALPPTARSDWWVSRIANVAGFVAATPRFAGAAADRLPIQAAFGASAQGLAVCAVAREHGVRDPDDWVPLLGRVLFDRDLGRGSTEAAVQEWAREQDGTDDPAGQLDNVDERVAPVAPAGAPGHVRRAGRTLVRLGSTFLAVNGMFDDRPRGALPFRALGKLPVVGLLGGWLDERGGVRKAARETEHLVAAAPPGGVDLTKRR